MNIFFTLALIATTGWALPGNQILHSKSDNKPYQDKAHALEFVETYLKSARPLESDAEVLRYASDQATLDGVYIELGVWKGRTLNFIAALNPHRTIYGFDSYEGLFEDWDKGDRVFEKGTFAWPENEKLPSFLLNIVLHKGWFADTLPVFAQEILREQPIAFLHVDCDIYSAAAEALQILGPYLREGTILLFDELYNYTNYRNHEWKAFVEFLEQFSFEAEYLAYNPLHEQVAVRLHK